MKQLVPIDEYSYLDSYLLDPITGPQEIPVKRPCLLVIPGGAYRFVSPREGQPVALRANTRGFHAAVLTYTVLPQKPDLTLDDLLGQVETALDWIEDHAETHHIDTERISVCGFSAGGHLAAWTSLRFKARIQKAVLCYGAIDFGREEMEAIIAHAESQAGTPYSEAERLVAKGMVRLFGDAPIEHLDVDTPPTFLWHTCSDETVPVAQSLEYAKRLLELKVPCELHLYERGVHGLSLADETTGQVAELIEPRIAGWFDLAISWLKQD